MPEQVADELFSQARGTIANGRMTYETFKNHLWFVWERIYDVGEADGNAGPNYTIHEPQSIRASISNRRRSTLLRLGQGGVVLNDTRFSQPSRRTLFRGSETSWYESASARFQQESISEGELEPLVSSDETVKQSYTGA